MEREGREREKENKRERVGREGERGGRGRGKEKSRTKVYWACGGEYISIVGMETVQGVYFLVQTSV